jgi:membrane protease YdiL (CAAX protease family)
MGKYGQSHGQISTTNNFTELFECLLTVDAYRAKILNSTHGDSITRKVALRKRFSMNRSLKKLLFFTVLTYLFAWSWWIPLLWKKIIVYPGQGWPTHLIGLTAPAISAIVLTAIFDRRTGLKDLWIRTKRLVPKKLSWGLIIITASCAFAPVILLKSVSVEDLTQYSGAPAIGIFGILIVLILNGYGEELGWRGFLAEELLKNRSVAKTAFWIWLIWMPWHLPLFWVVASYREMGLIGFLGWAVTIYFGSVFLTWLYVYNNNSVLMVVLWHVAYNYAVATDAAVGMTASIVSSGVIFIAIWVMRRPEESRNRV